MARDTPQSEKITHQLLFWSGSEEWPQPHSSIEYCPSGDSTVDRVVFLPELCSKTPDNSILRNLGRGSYAHIVMLCAAHGALSPTGAIPGGGGGRQRAESQCEVAQGAARLLL